MNTIKIIGGFNTGPIIEFFGGTPQPPRPGWPTRVEFRRDEETGVRHIVSVRRPDAAPAQDMR